MGLRFRRRIALAPGIRMNASLSGISWSLGPRGASLGIGRRGLHLNTGIPGTGIYFRDRLDRQAHHIREFAPEKTKVAFCFGVDDDGSMFFQDDNGNPLADHLVDVAKKQKGNELREFLSQRCDQINAQIKALGEIHLYTPSPNLRPRFQPENFPTPQPKLPKLKKYSVLAKLFKSKREAIDQQNESTKAKYADDLAHWQKEKQRFEAQQKRREEMIQTLIYSDLEAMEDFLEENLQDIVWPRETVVSMEIGDGGKAVFVDVDLPEIENMPTKTATVPQRFYRLSIKEMSATKVQQLYMRHVHGIGFRIVGEIFAALPNAQQVVLSAYSQRANKATGQTADEYLYSVRVERVLWSKIDFDNLQGLDAVEALMRFDMRRNMSKAGAFKSIEPFGPN